MQDSKQETDTGNEVIPAPPAGYGNPVRFQYPTLTLILLSIVVIALSVPLVGRLVLWIHDAPDSFSFTVHATDFMAFWATMLVTVVLHELIHALAARLLGYRITFGIKWRMAAPYVAVFHQFMPRNHNILIAAAPLVLLTVLIFPLLFVAVPLVLTVAITLLVINMAGSAGDLYLCWRLLRYPPETLLYDVSADCMLIFPPKASNMETSLVSPANIPE